jgi:hypothetical protein
MAVGAVAEKGAGEAGSSDGLEAGGKSERIVCQGLCSGTHKLELHGSTETGRRRFLFVREPVLCLTGEGELLRGLLLAHGGRGFGVCVYDSDEICDAVNIFGRAKRMVSRSL